MMALIRSLLRYSSPSGQTGCTAHRVCPRGISARRVQHIGLLTVMAALTLPGALQADPFVRGPLVQVSGLSPFQDLTRDDVAHQPGRNTLNSELEPWVTANPVNPDNIACVWQQDRWSDGGARSIVAGVTLDGGQNWDIVVIPGLTLVSDGIFQRASDPWASFAPNGDLYVVSLVLNSTRAGSGVLVSKSADGGYTWDAPVTIIDDRDPRILNDKESITADPLDSNYVYTVWDRIDGNRQPALFSRTTDGGQSWEDARAIYDPGAGNYTINHQILVTPDGTLYDFFTEGVRGQGVLLSFISSTDQGATWDTANGSKKVLPLRSREVVTPDTQESVRSGDGLASVAVDPSSGALYATWAANDMGGLSRIAFSASFDGGGAWSAPIAVNQTPTDIPPLSQQAFTPTVQVSSNGTVAVAYYDFRFGGTQTGALTDRWLVHCDPDADCTDPASWIDETRITETSFNIKRAPVARGYFLGDYMGLTNIGTDFGVLEVQPHDNDPDSVFFRRVGSAH